MNYIIEQARLEDAKNVIEYLNIVTTESDNLTITKKQVEEISIKDEELIIESYLYNKTGIMLLAKYKGEIISLGNLKGNDINGKSGHKVALGVTVKKKYWNMGIGRELIDSLLQFAVNSDHIEIVELEVKSDNYAAISLYERFGFERIGYYKNYFKYKDEYGDAILMNLYL